MAEMWIIASAQGGAGKTYVAAELGRALARRQKRVVLVDLNPGFGQLDMALGLENSVVYHLLDVAGGLCRLSQALVREGQDGPSLLAAPANEHCAVPKDALTDILEKLKEHFDYVLLDGPAGISDAFLSAAGMADLSIMVLRPGHSVRSNRYLLSLLKKEGSSRQKVLCNFSKKPDPDIGELDAEYLGGISKGGGDSEFDHLAAVLMGEMNVKTAGMQRRESAVKRFQRGLDGAPI